MPRTVLDSVGAIHKIERAHYTEEEEHCLNYVNDIYTMSSSRLLAASFKTM